MIIKLTTLNEMWLYACKKYGYNRAVCSRKTKKINLNNGKTVTETYYSCVTYNELEASVINLSCGLMTLGLKEKEAVAVFAENCLEWITIDLAVLGCRSFNVPRGTSASKRELKFILVHSESKFVFVQGQTVLDWILNMSRDLPKLKFIITFENNLVQKPVKGIKIYSFNELLKIGEEAIFKKSGELTERRQKTLPEDIATLMYTSGTSGEPKGTPLTHANIMHNVRILPGLVGIYTTDKFLSILPIWHILERTCELTALSIGASIWYTSSMSLIKDFGLAKPTIMISVPRVWILVYNGFFSKLKNAGKIEVFNKFYSHSIKVINKRRYKQNRQYTLIGREPVKQKASVSDHFFHFLGKILIYNKVKAKIGKKFKLAISGGGSLPEYIDDFFEVVGICLIEGYGLTETSPVLCVRTPGHRIPYTVGKPMPETEIQIRDDNGRVITNSDKGTIWACGPQVMKGYYKNKKETDKVIVKDADGKVWFNTGDLGKRSRYGDITILGRIKDTIVLIGGENVEPAPIERTLLKSSYIDQVMVCGQDQEYLTALIVPDEEYLKETCKKLNIVFDGKKIKELSGNKDIKKIYMDEINNSISLKTGFKKLELIHNICFTDPFTPETETLTHTLKVKKHKVYDRDYKLIKNMYPHYNEG